MKEWFDKTRTVVVGIIPNMKYEISARVYSQHALAPTIRTMSGGGWQPKILVRHKTDEIKNKTSC